MTCILTTEERTRLEKLVGMLGSSADGEVVNAARFIKRMADGKRVTIADLLMKATVQGERAGGSGGGFSWQGYAEEYRARQNAKQQASAKWQKDLQEALDAHNAGPRFMTGWEAVFAADILSRKWPDLSDKQRAVVDKILDKHVRLRKAQADFG